MGAVIKAKLKNWLAGAHGQLYGEVYGDPRYPDGTSVQTTKIVEWDKDGRWVQTKNTYYELEDERDPHGNILRRS